MKMKCFTKVTPEDLANFVNANFNVLNADGTPGVFSVELAAEFLSHPEWFRDILPEVPPDAILGGNDE